MKNLIASMALGLLVYTGTACNDDPCIDDGIPAEEYTCGLRLDSCVDQGEDPIECAREAAECVGVELQVVTIEILCEDPNEVCADLGGEGTGSGSGSGGSDESSTTAADCTGEDSWGSADWGGDSADETGEDSDDSVSSSDDDSNSSSDDDSADSKCSGRRCR